MNNICKRPTKIYQCLLKKLSKYPIEVKLLPSLSSLVEGKVSIERIRHVEVQDILGRVPVAPKSKLLINKYGVETYPAIVRVIGNKHKLYPTDDRKINKLLKFIGR